MVALIATAYSFIFIYAAVLDCKAIIAEDLYKWYQTYRDIEFLRWINLVFFTTMLIVVSVIMMRKLRLRFYSLYTDYGSKLLAIYIVQAISLLLMTIYEILDYYNQTW